MRSIPATRRERVLLIEVSLSQKELDKRRLPGSVRAFTASIVEMNVALQSKQEANAEPPVTGGADRLRVVQPSFAAATPLRT